MHTKLLKVPKYAILLEFLLCLLEIGSFYIPISILSIALDTIIKILHVGVLACLFAFFMWNTQRNKQGTSFLYYLLFLVASYMRNVVFTLTINLLEELYTLGEGIEYSLLVSLTNTLSFEALWGLGVGFVWILTVYARPKNLPYVDVLSISKDLHARQSFIMALLFFLEQLTEELVYLISFLKETYFMVKTTELISMVFEFFFLFVYFFLFWVLSYELKKKFSQETSL